jgi:small neutral amino acid transporter SnatA (MarC family)
MVFARHSGVASTTPDEDREARVRKDIAVFPLATPLIAGPGAIGCRYFANDQYGWRSLPAVGGDGELGRGVCC